MILNGTEVAQGEEYAAERDRISHEKPSPRLPNEVMDIVCSSLSDSQQLASLASLCAASTTYCSIGLPYLYRKFCLTKKSAASFSDMLALLTPHSPPLDIERTTASTFPGAEQSTGEHALIDWKDPRSRAKERAKLIKSFVLDDYEAATSFEIEQASCRIAQLADRGQALFPSTQVFCLGTTFVAQLRRMDFDALYDPVLSRTVEERFGSVHNIWQILGSRRLCVSWSNVLSELAQPDEGPPDGLLEDLIQRLAVGETPLLSVCIHRYRAGGIWHFPFKTKNFDIYYDLRVWEEAYKPLYGQSHVGLMHDRLDEIMLFAQSLLKAPDPNPILQARFHALSNHDRLRSFVDSLQDQDTSLDFDRPTHVVARDIFYTLLKEDHYDMRYRGSDNKGLALEEVLKRLVEVIVFCPAPSEGELCPHCGTSLL